jgi:predicted acylesterase/phospholipase RssA
MLLAQSTVKPRMDLPRRQRALIFQGGVALGAYEAGVFRKLYDWVNPYVRDDENVFDIVVGASIGAINGAILVSHVASNRRKGAKKSWEDAPDKLERFWRENSTISMVEYLMPGFSMWWQGWHETVKLYKKWLENILKQQYVMSSTSSSSLSSFPSLFSNPYAKQWYEWARYMMNFIDTPATGESARRYFSSVQFINEFAFPFSGAPNVSKSLPKPDGRFIFNYRNYVARIDNENFPFYSLRDSLNKIYFSDGSKFADFPIRTSYDENLPRYLLVTVDVENGETIAFDSYTKADGSRKTEYEYDEHLKKFRHAIIYNDGIKWDHVRTGAATPQTFKYPTLEDSYSPDDPKEERTFWDGSLLSNTPMRELIHLYREFWSDYITHVRKNKLWDGEQGDKIPELDIYIVNLWPTKLKDKPVPYDNDFIHDRLFDLIFHDKTGYEEKVTKMTTDYVNIISGLLPLARKTNSKEVDNILKNLAASKTHLNEKRTYREMLEGQFEINHVVRIERSDDEDSISIDMTDYSLGTTDSLIRQGESDTERTISELKIQGFVP